MEGILEQKFKFEVTQSVHGMPSIQLRNPSPEIREMISRAVQANRIDDPAYQLKQKAGAFLQADYDDFVLVEFWQKGYQPFVDYLNEKLEENP